MIRNTGLVLAAAVQVLALLVQFYYLVGMLIVDPAARIAFVVGVVAVPALVAIHQWRQWRRS